MGNEVAGDDTAHRPARVIKNVASPPEPLCGDSGGDFLFTLQNKIEENYLSLNSL